LTNNNPDFILIRYHWYYPDNTDPYYQYNVSENMARSNYYNNNYSPHMFFDGSVDGGYTPSSWQGKINSEDTVNSAAAIELWGYYNPDSLSGSLHVRIITESAPGLNNLKLRIALIESSIHRTSPNGTQVHHQVLRDMIPSAAGRAVTLVAGDTLEYSFSFACGSPMVDDNCQLVAFIQADQNRKVIQAARIDVPDLTPTGIEDESPTPGIFTLSQNYPNPFNAQTKIDFSTAGGNARLDVFDICGAKVATILDGSLAPGVYSVIWDGKNSNGQTVSSGTYLYRLTDGANIQTKRMTLLK
jgi:hypothetical protein